MHVVSISLSPSVLDTDSVTACRLSQYGRVTTTYTIVVPYTKDVTVQLADNVVAYGIGGSNKIVKLFRIYKKVMSLITANQCDVLSADPYFFGLLGVYFSNRRNIGFEVSALGFEKFMWLRKHIARFVCRHADSIRVNSPRLVRFVEDELGISGEKVHMIPIYVDVEIIGLRGGKNEMEQQEYNLHVADFQKQYGAHFNFLSVNRLVPAKNIALQLRAVVKIKELYPEVYLHILGDGPLLDTLQNDIQKLNIEEHVTLHGYVDGMKLGAFYTSCDCFLLTSDSEGWGMVTVEALTAQLPIIMTDVGSAGEVIIDGESGIVIPVNDVQALTDAMQRLIEDADERNRLIIGGNKSLQSLKTIDELLVMYRNSWEYTLNNNTT